MNKQEFDFIKPKTPKKEEERQESQQQQQQYVLSDERLMENYLNEKHLQQLEDSIAESQPLPLNFDSSLQQRQTQAFLEDAQERTQLVNQGKKQMQDYELELERLFMEREDKLSREIERFNHCLKFIQKDMHPPLLPPYLTQSDNPLKNKPVQKTPIPNAPMTDNFVKYRTNVGGTIPTQAINLKQIKILWSREKEEVEEEKAKEIEKQRQKEIEHRRLNKLVQYSQEQSRQIEQDAKQNNKHVQEQLNKFISCSKEEQKVNITVQQKIEIKVNIVGKEPKLYKSPNEIYSKNLIKKQEELSSQLIKIIPSLEKALPNLKDTEEPKPKIVKKRKSNKNEFGNDNFMQLPQINDNNQNSIISQVLELHAPDTEKSDKIEIKNEQISLLELGSFNSYKNLMHLNLSMNKIQQIQGSIDCPFLSQLRLSDNQIKELPPNMLNKCVNLRILQLDINQIKNIQNLQALTNLEELSMANNQIQTLEGIQNLTKLRRLNLSFNKLTTLDNFLNNLTFLEYLELGKNFISNIDKFPAHKLLFLSELYLYSNQLMNLPKDFGITQLKTLNLNRNQDLHQISIGYCPLLESLSVSYCSIVQIKQLTGCPNLKELDISFNSLNNLENFMNIIRFNKELKNLRFNDNPFSVNKELHFQYSLSQLYQSLERVNGEVIPAKINLSCEENKYQKEMLNLLSLTNMQCQIRSFVTKQMSQKIRVTFSSTTFLMKYYKNMIPSILLKSLTQSINKYNEQQTMISILSLNQLYVQKLRSSVGIITRFMRHRKIKRRALIVNMQKHVSKIVKIQSLIKGHMVRVKNEAIVMKIKRDGPKKTKKYQQVAKIQANVKGFLFRQRRIKALQRLNQKNKDFEEDLGEFDADTFFGIQKDVFDSGLSLPQEQMMQQMISMMAVQSQQAKKPQFYQQQKASQGVSDTVKFPPIGQKQGQASSISMNDKIKPKTMIQQQNQRQSQNRGSNRPPSARSNAISEIDMNSDTQSLRQPNKNSAMNNNLMTSTHDQFNNPHFMPSILGSHLQDDQSERQSVYSMNSNPFYPTHAQAYKKKVDEERKKEIEKNQEVIDEWGFQNEETKKMFEARLKKKNHGKKKILTADEKFQKFKALNEGSRRK